MQLNEEQIQAVEHPIGSPTCLIAGAGSGNFLHDTD
jgi:superfamily I DNA/RNA helicase